MKTMDMSRTIDAVWDALQKDTEKWQEFDSDIQFDQNKKEAFRETFIQLYNDIKTKYMKKKVWALDRHKVASIMIVSAIENQIVTYDEAKLKPNQKFVGCEMITAEVALFWMLQQFNMKLEEEDYTPITQYKMPEAYACKTSYFEIFYRNLYYGHSDGYKLNPLDIAEKFFLIEYITMISENIDISILKE